MEAAVRAHPLWGGCSEEDLHSAGEVSHRYLHISWDLGLNYLLLLFLSNLDTKPTFQNETSWLDQTRKVFRECPYMFVHFSDLKINDVEDLNNYKQLVFKYVCF
ncbi:hypothetical protein E1A91_A05G246400v1 [Gossypium mustelinum]|uniref:Uncharacterized protein n=4 Tax=Gossypium TaxID=3633 RepID=A0A5J5VTV2_GOSBA|nr:hypothetical protein ES319_A05G240400v1 [Gossypium barbadense]TYH18147.1 hypothetical protein ES288_A05G246600v1 [Gossypium darwinii]TYI28528.1 hypothetical protein ES332_A05G251200v1 [Gossypium tomentosum]TYJ35579.1 hypothetical protein E1A91_A05G246400v1 [Gossypium mustelinum]